MGNTTIKFNQATMVEAVQMYLDAQFTDKHTVTSVKAVSGTAYNTPDIFDVEIRKEEPSENRA